MKIHYSLLVTICSLGLLASANAASLMVGSSIEYNFSTAAGYTGDGSSGTYANTVRLAKSGGHDNGVATRFVHGDSTGFAYDNYGNLTGVSVSAVPTISSGTPEFFNDPPDGGEPGFIGSKNGAVITMTFSGLDANVIYDFSLALGGVYSSGHNVGFNILTGWISDSSTTSTGTTGTVTGGQYTGIGTADITNHATYSWSGLRPDSAGNIVLEYTANGPRSGISNMKLTAVGMIPEPSGITLTLAGMFAGCLLRRRKQ